MKGGYIIMKKMIITLMAMMVFSFSIANSAVAAEKDEYPLLADLKTISSEDLPDGIIPISFESQEEAEIFLSDLKNQISIIESQRYLTADSNSNLDIGILATNSNLLVQELNLYTCKISLYANYGTSGNSNTGTITYISPYTTMTGLTVGLDWTESNADYNISSNQKDAYIFANGTLNYYLLIEGLIKIGSDRVSLGRTCYLAR